MLIEGLRLSPGIATRMARIAPDRELVYGEWVIPVRAPVSMTTLLMHTDETLYADAKRFDPERWTDIDRGKKCEKTYAFLFKKNYFCKQWIFPLSLIIFISYSVLQLFLPFAKFSSSLAWAELYLTLAALVRRFDFKFDGTGPKDIECVIDQFIIGTEDQNDVKVYVMHYQG